MRSRQAVRRGCSQAKDAATAAQELHDAIHQPGIGLAVFFCSPSYDLDALAAEIHRRFGAANIIGCTTAGEIGPAGYLEGSITGFSIAAESCQAVTALIPDISTFQVSRGRAIADALADQLGRPGQPLDPKTHFAMLLVDGLSTNQEAILSSLNRSLDPIPLFGGSAGDDMRLQQAHVYHGGRFWPDAALLTLVRTQHAFKAFRCQHYEGSDTKMVVTEADPGRQVVTEINAEPAAREYARIIGVDLQDLTPLAFAENPLMVRVGGDYYVRSIQKADADGSLTFFCAIDVGVVLTLARRRDIVDELRGLFRGLRQEIGPPQLVIGFDCVLRGLELGERQLKRVVSTILAENNVIGFGTYGEQFAGMHFNQTFTGVAIGGGS